MSKTERASPVFASTRYVVLIYAVFTTLWIALTDQLVAVLTHEPQLMVRMNTAKGWFFVVVTSVLLYRLIHQLAEKIREQSAAREQALRESHRKLAAFIEDAPAALAMLDRGLCYLAASSCWKTAHGFPDGLAIVGRCHYDVCAETPARWKEAFLRALDGDVVVAKEDCLRRADGTEQWLHWEVTPWRADEGETIGGVIVFSEDITDRKHSEGELRIAAAAFECQQAVMITDRSAIILRVNQAFERVTGYSAEEVVGLRPHVLTSGRQDTAFYDRMWASLRSTHSWRGEIWNRRKNGEIYPEDLNISAVIDGTGEVTNYVGTFTDISKHKLAEETIRSLSFYDPLTGLPNRRLTFERLKEDLSLPRRVSHYGGIFVIDLDRFSLLNDTRSHHVGDAVLTETAQRISRCAADNDIVGRLSGDEFVMLVDELGTERERAALRARNIAERLLAAIRQPVVFEGAEHFCTACIGIRIYLGGKTEMDDLVKQANSALYQAKQQGRDRFHFFDGDMQVALEERVALESLLRRAMPSELLLHCQPQVDQAGNVSGVEALIRWRHPKKGIIFPADFIPLAEETGMILPIGRWVLETACFQLKAWESDPGMRPLSLAVNVSAQQFAQPTFVDEVFDAIEMSGADPRKLELELTESMLFADADVVTQKMAVLKAKGIRFSLDDFGTGFSSLAYLRRMPIDKLKIDQSFITDVHSNANDAAIARTIIALGRSLGLSVIAEGVETEEQRSFLAVHGCVSYQGFLFGRPITFEALERRVRSETRELH